MLYYLSNFKGLTIGVGFNGAVEPRRHGDLGICRLRSEIVRGIAETLANSVDTDESTCIKVVLTGNVTGTLGVHLLPLGVRITGKQLCGVELDLGVAVGGLVSSSEGHGSRAANVGIGSISIRKALIVVTTVIAVIFAVIIHVHVIHSRCRRGRHRHRSRVITSVHVHAGSRTTVVIVVLKALDSLYDGRSTKNSNTQNDEYSHKTDYGAK